MLLGSIRGWQELASFSDLWTTAYGRVLGLKVALVLGMLPLSLLSWRRQETRPRTEGVLAVGVVLAAGVLAAFPVPPGRGGDAVSPRPAESQGPPQSRDLTLAREAGTTVVGLSIRPAEPGINDLYVHPASSAAVTSRRLAWSWPRPAPWRTEPCCSRCSVRSWPPAPP